MPDPRQMITEQYDLEQRQLTQEFDQMRHMLGQQNLEPEEHDKAYKKMLMQFQQKSDSMFYRNESQAQALNQFNKMVADGVMPKEEGEKAKWGVAGLSSEQIRGMFPKERPTDWVSEYNENRLLIKNLQDFTGKFRQRDWPGTYFDKMFYEDPATEKERPATKQEIQRLREVEKILDERITYHRDVLLPNLSVNQRAAGMGRNAIISQSMGQQPQEPRVQLSGRIRVKSPDGQTGTIEAGEWESYKTQGFRKL